MRFRIERPELEHVIASTVRVAKLDAADAAQPFASEAQATAGTDVHAVTPSGLSGALPSGMMSEMTSAW